jgi:hypothetical protein
MKVAIACSMKYKDLIIETMEKFSDLHITPLFPDLDANDKTKKELALNQYKAIDEARVVYFICPQGYMGTSCKLELGYAIARNKIIIFSESTLDEALDCYVDFFIPPTDLSLFINL